MSNLKAVGISFCMSYAEEDSGRNFSDFNVSFQQTKTVYKTLLLLYRGELQVESAHCNYKIDERRFTFRLEIVFL